MKELVKELIERADLTEAQAERAAGVVKGFVEQRVPEAIRGPVIGALTGENVDATADAVKGALGKLF